MTDAYILNVGMTEFGNLGQQSLRSLTRIASDEAINKSGISAADIGRIYFGNAGAATTTGQEMIRGQVMLRNTPLAGTPLINVENACASSGSALLLAYEAVRSGLEDLVLVIGAEKMHVPEKIRAFQALWGSCDTFEIGEFEPGSAKSSVLMDCYADVARQYMQESGATVEDFARIAVKNRDNASNNPIAQYRIPQTVDDVINARMIADPLTLPMCAPLTDGCAALLVCSKAYLDKRGTRESVRINACTLASGKGDGISPVVPSSQLAYERAGCGPRDLDLIELHDAAAPAELLQYEEVGLCGPGEARELVRSAATELKGKIPVNTSGGLLSRGHALGATGAAQVAELFYQLTGTAEGRQLEKPRLAMAVNGGGWIAGTYALAVTTICEKIKFR